MRKTSIWLLGFIVLLALMVRAWGLPWGAPLRVDLHPDEHDYVMTYAVKMMDRMGLALHHPGTFSHRTLDPEFRSYSGLLYYLIALAGGFLRLVGAIRETWEVYVVGRGIVVCFGVATVPLVYRLARELGATNRGALLGALWMALLPLHTWESHTATTDVPMAFWTTLTLYAAVRLLRAHRWRDYVFAGLALGLAVGTKVTAALAVVAILVAALASGRPFSEKLARLAVCGLASAAACFLVTPFSFIHFKATLAAMAYEHTHTTGHHYGFCVYAMGWWFRRWIYQVVAAWPFSLGFALYGSCVAGALWALRRFDRRTLVVVSFAAFYFLVTGSWTFTPLRYYLPLLVIAVVWAGRWMGDWMESPSRALRLCAVFAATVTALYTAVFTAQTADRFRQDTRMQAEQWIQDSVAPGTTLNIFGWARYQAEPQDLSRFQVRFLDESQLALEVSHPGQSLFEVSSMLYARHYRHGNTGLMESYGRLRDPRGAFELVKQFEAHFINKQLYMKLDPMFEGYFVSPTIEFYRAKPVAAVRAAHA